jgi:hypothetical protein
VAGGTVKRVLMSGALLGVVLSAGWILWPSTGAPPPAGNSRRQSAAVDRAAAARPPVPPPVVAAASLSGVVVRRGAPVPGAQVRLRADGSHPTVQTGADGRFHFAQLPPGYHVLSATLGAEASEVHGPVLLGPGQVREDVVLELLPSASVAGVVADVRTRAPIVGATVRSSSGAAVTDHAGRFRLTSLPATMTWVEAGAPGYETRLEWLQIQGAREHGGMELFLRASIALRGRVTRLGAPAPGAQLWAERAQLGSTTERFGPVTTDGEGRFALEVPSGDFQLAAAAPGGARVAGPRLTVAEGGSYEELNVELGQALTARGTVLLDGYPAQGASLMLLEAGSQQLAAGAVTGPGGDFRFEGLCAGSFLVQVQAGAVVAQRGPFEVTGGGDADWQIELSGQGGIHGRVEPPRAGVVVRARTTEWAGAMAAETLTAEGGAFSFSGFPAGAIVELEAEAEDAWARARTQVGAEVVLRLFASAVVGYAIDSQGRAVTDFQVRVVPEAGGMPRSSPILHPRGEFRVPVPPGRFRVEASSPGSGETEGPVFTEVSPGRESPTVKLELSPVEAVSGQVVDGHTGEPIAGAQVTVQRRRDSQAMQFERWMVVRTDAQGRFSLGGVARRGALQFRAEGYRTAWLGVERMKQLPEGTVRLARARAGAGEGGAPQTYEGVGMHLRTDKESGAVYVDGVFDGSPAQAAGIIRNDQIVAVDGAAVTGLPVQQVVSRIVGPSGTVVRLSLRRGPDALEVAVRRRSIDL